MRESSNEIFEMSLINIILQFVGNIFIAFKFYPSDCKDMILNDVQVFKRKHTGSGMKDMTVGCSLKWKKGIHQISFKSNTKAHADDAWGIITNISKVCDDYGWFYIKSDKSDGEIIGYTMNGGDIMDCPDPSDWDNDIGTRQDNVITVQECKAGDIITIQFDGDSSIVSLLLNGKIKGKPQSITAGKVYHPFICHNSDCDNDADYTIILDQSW